MSKITRFVPTHYAFADWDMGNQQAVHSSSFHALNLEVREKCSCISKGQFCHVCGKWIPKGQKAYRTMAYHDDESSQSGLATIHTTPCIPRILIVFTFADESTYTFGNDRLDRDYVEIIGEPDIRTLKEAEEFAGFASRQLSEYTSGWMHYSISMDGKIIKGSLPDTCELEYIL